MLWCIPTLPFHLLPTRRKRRRFDRSVKISAPIRRRSGSMHLRSSSFSENVHGSTHVDDSGAFYIIPNKSGNGKTKVRRRAPVPPTTLPNIEESQPRASTSKAAEMTPITNGKRPTLAIRTTTPLTELNDGSTARQTPPKPRYDPMKTFRNSFRGSSLRVTENGDLENHPKRWKGKERATADQNEGDESRESRVAAKAREIREWMKGKSGSDMHRAATYSGGGLKRKNLNGDASYATKTRQTVSNVQDLFKNKKTEDRGPKAGQTYEIVDRRIIENNPERTVEISTWREHAAGKESKAKEDDDKMSIYYISADEYPQEGEFASEMSPKVEWRAEGSDPPPVPEKPKPRPESLPHRESSARKGESSKIERRETGKSNARRPRHEDLKTPTSILSRTGSISASTSDKDPDASSLTRRPSNSGSRFVEHIVPGSSTPKENRGTRTTRHKAHGQYKEFTRIEKALPQSPGPFHPTRSGSTISSIKSESTVKFEGVLQSCEPSLIHIAPILRSLGIRRVEHLRAVARLTPNTRDREVKEDALRLGITVMEWAIFVDRMFAL